MALVSAALTRVLCVINSHELCDVINMVAAREGENNKKEEDDESGSLFKRTRWEVEHRVAIFPQLKKNSQVGGIVCFTNKKSRLCSFQTTKYCLSPGKTEILSVFEH